MLVHDRYTLRSYPFEVVLRGLLVWAGQRLDEDDILMISDDEPEHNTKFAGYSK